MEDITGFYIKYNGHPSFQSEKIETDDALALVIDKLEMILFTNKGEVFGDSDFGADIESYLWQTNISADKIKTEVIRQITKYIPEINKSHYNVDFKIMKGNVKDIGFLHIKLVGADVRAVFA